MSSFTPLMPHGELTRVFSDVYVVTGTSRPLWQGVSWQYSRNMIVVCENDALTLINTVRLDDAGLQALEDLGTIKNVVRLGAFHGMDDAFYVERYQAKLWALPGMTHECGLITTVELRPGGPMPFHGASLFVFETAKEPEGILLIDRDDGILVACDSLQNWCAPDRFFSPETAERMTALGFIRPANVGPGWREACDPRPEDFRRLLELPFRHLLSAHGEPLRDRARELLAATFRELFEAEDDEPRRADVDADEERALPAS